MATERPIVGSRQRVCQREKDIDLTPEDVDRIAARKKSLLIASKGHLRRQGISEGILDRYQTVFVNFEEVCKNHSRVLWINSTKLVRVGGFSRGASDTATKLPVGLVKRRVFALFRNFSDSPYMAYGFKNTGSALRMAANVECGAVWRRYKLNTALICAPYRKVWRPSVNDIDSIINSVVNSTHDLEHEGTASIGR
ncbi:unnamed protein product [Toxocara canis]|uniref:DUF1893 domain-containing protein n=1 Tax=Toxocara canis TaxID=6265 RepID=A0A183VEH1_TOXCA|nr:unnamed protein product [Toxocara canis]